MELFGALNAQHAPALMLFYIQHWTVSLLDKAAGAGYLLASILNTTNICLACVVPVRYILYLFNSGSEEREAEVCESLSGC